MFRHILTPLSPTMDTPLALEVSAALARGGVAPVVSVAPLTVREIPPSDEMPHGAIEHVTEAEAVGIERQVDLIIVAPKRREQCEIEWYPHTAAWSLLRLHTPLLFWPPGVAPSSLLAATKPLIVVPLDGHKHAEQAIPFACSLAETFGGELLLVHVVPASLSDRRIREALPALRGKRLARVHEVWGYLHDVREATIQRTSVQVTTKVLIGEPGSALVRLAQRQGANAIVMTTHSRTHAGRFFAGAVATQVLRQSPAPTLLIPLGAETEPTQHSYYESFMPVTP